MSPRRVPPVRLNSGLVLVLVGLLLTLVALLAAPGLADTPPPVVRPPRAYEGAPPAIPHKVWASDRTSCLDCHSFEAASDGAIPVPHGRKLRCLQCHVEANRKNELFRASTFEGMKGNGRLPRASAGAPPVVPHRLFLRESCLACHGPDGYTAIRTPHPERTRCLQCHVTRSTESLFRENRFDQ